MTIPYPTLDLQPLFARNSLMAQMADFLAFSCGAIAISSELLFYDTVVFFLCSIFADKIG